MCGRYASSRNPDDLVEEVVATGLPLAPLAEADRETLRPSYNVAPTQQVAVVMAPRPATEVSQAGAAGEASGAGAAGEASDAGAAGEAGGAGAAAEAAPSRLRAMRWGLVPSWAKDPSIGSRMINARVETVAEKPSYRSLVSSRRCLLPADGWFEWQTVPADRSPTGKARKQPFLMSPPGGGLVGLAGLYSWWRDPDVADDADPAAWLGSVTVLTTAAEPALQAVHDRMPVVLPPEDWAVWVSRDVPADEALALVRSLPEGRFAAVPVQAAVGNVRNDSAALLDRPSEPDLAGVVDPMTGQLFG